MRARSRVNYDVIAHLYDGQPYRRKTVDPELETFVAQHASPDRLSLLDIAWVRADGAKLPFRAEGFDLICCQFGFHHLADKAGMLEEVFKVLRPGGRFVMRNLCPLSRYIK